MDGYINYITTTKYPFSVSPGACKLAIFHTTQNHANPSHVARLLMATIIHLKRSTKFCVLIAENSQ